MSLTHLIKTSSTFRNKIIELFPMPLTSWEKPNISYPPLINSYGIIGTAFDYLLRFYLQWKYKDNSNITIKNKDYFIADIGMVQLIKMMNDNNKVTINNLKNLYEKYYQIIIQTIKQKAWVLSNDFLIALIFMSNLDIVYRTGRSERLLTNNWKSKLSILTKELGQLASVLDSLPFTVTTTVSLNPTFNIIPTIIKNADADLIIDNEMLIDIKTTQKLSLAKQDWCQLIGYYVLSHLNNISIKTLAIYYARFNFLWQINVEQYGLNKNIKLFMSWIDNFDG